MIRTPISADSHITEPPGCYVDHIEPSFRDRAPVMKTLPGVGSAFIIDGKTVYGFTSLADLEARGVELIRLETAKDETDTEAALRLAVERGVTEITVFNALGGPRLDHLLGNLLLLTAPWLAPARVTLVDGLHKAFLVAGDGAVSGRAGDTVSLLPLTEMVEDVRTEGLLYPLRGETLHQGATRGVSNEMTGERARVTHGAGALLLIHYRGR